MAKITNWKEQKEYWDKKRKEGAKKYQAKRKLVKPVVIKRVALKKKPRKIKPQSKKEAARYRKYLKIRKIWFEDPANQVCKLNMTKECRERGEPSQEVHHTKGRVGELLFDTRYWLPASRKCHHLIDEKTGEAIEKGVVKSRHAQN